MSQCDRFSILKVKRSLSEAAVPSDAVIRTFTDRYERLVSVVCAAAQYGLTESKEATFVDVRADLISLMPRVEILFTGPRDTEIRRTRIRGLKSVRTGADLRRLLETKDLQTLIGRDRGDLLPLLVRTSNTIYAITTGVLGRT